MKPDTSAVINKMATSGENPLEYDQLVGAWHSLCEQSWSEGVDDFQFADIESAAVAALSNNPGRSRKGFIGSEISRLLSHFDYPTYLVSVEGQVAALNVAATREFELDIGDKIDALPFSVATSQPISILIKNKLQNVEKDESDALLKHAYGKDIDKEATIAITASRGRTPTALVFVITTQWKPSSAKLLKRQFGLTDAESEILISFVNGYSSQDISKLRSRSHTTVRTQFQSILAKTGARNQTELLRTSLSVSSFVDEIGEIVNAVNHPHRRRAEILREGGRLIELTLMGDSTGSPVLFIANASYYTFNAEIEQCLFDAGLYIISLCTPGCGRSDPVPDGENRHDCTAVDAGAVLDQLGIQKCPVMAYNANAPLSFALSNRLPGHITHLVLLAGSIPAVYMKSCETLSPWASGVLKAGISHPALKKFLFSGAMKAWSKIGAERFVRLQMSSNPVDARFMLLPENVHECEHALKTATRTGISSAAEDFIPAFDDWSVEVDRLSIKVTAIHGVMDKLTPIESAREFAAAYPGKILMIEIEGAGFPLLQSHTCEVVEHLRTVVEQYG